jgi:hypothetical protein
MIDRLVLCKPNLILKYVKASPDLNTQYNQDLPVQIFYPYAGPHAIPSWLSVVLKDQLTKRTFTQQQPRVKSQNPQQIFGIANCEMEVANKHMC